MSPIFRSLCSISLGALAIGCANVSSVDIPPTAAGTGLPVGALVVDIWNNVPADPSVDDGWNGMSLISPTDTRFVSSADLVAVPYDSFVVKMSGYFIPAEDGDYVLFISGEQTGALYFSGDASISKMELAAYFSSPTGRKVWTKFPTQGSKKFSLKAGVRYPFDAFGWDKGAYDYLAVAWSKVNIDGSQTAPQIISGSVLSPRIETKDPEAEKESYAMGYRIGYTDGRYSFPFDLSYPFKDGDKDGLPDNWELAYGLDPINDADALFDSDGDGLYALLEFMTGTSPSKADTDGDGMADSWEYRRNLDPLDASDAQLVDPVSGLTFAALYRKETGPEFVLRFSWEPTLRREDGTVIAIEDIAYLIVSYGETETKLSNKIEIPSPKSGPVEIPVSGVTTYFISLQIKDVNGRLSSATVPVELMSLEVK